MSTEFNGATLYAGGPAALLAANIDVGAGNIQALGGRDFDGTAFDGAGGDDVATDADVFTVDLNRPGLGGVARYVQCAGAGDRRAFEQDAATLLCYALGFNGAAVDDTGGQLVGGSCREDDEAVRRFDGRPVLNQGVELGGADGNAFQLAGWSEVQRNAFPSRHGHRAGLGE